MDPSRHAIIRGNVYELTPEFLARHPGGGRLARYALGHDATNLFESYHVLPSSRLRAAALLRSLPCVSSQSEAEVESGLLAALKLELARALSSGEVEAVSSALKAAYAGSQLLFAVGLVVSAVAGARGSFASALTAAFCGVQLGFHAMHAASHGALWRGWNGVALEACTALLGFSSRHWEAQHVYGHHLHVNDAERDPDVNPVRLLRFSSAGPQRYAFVRGTSQASYAALLYAATAIMFWLAPLPSSKVRLRADPVEVFLSAARSRALVLSWIVVCVVSQGWLHACTWLLCTLLLVGLCLGCVFEVSHVSASLQPWNGADFAERQVRSSVNYACDSPVVSYAVGYLNFQIEHHLFPGLHPLWYPRLAPLVRRVCEARGVPYVEHRSFVEAWRNHLAALRNLD